MCTDGGAGEVVLDYPCGACVEIGGAKAGASTIEDLYKFGVWSDLCILLNGSGDGVAVCFVTDCELEIIEDMLRF